MYDCDKRWPTVPCVWCHVLGWVACDHSDSRDNNDSGHTSCYWNSKNTEVPFHHDVSQKLTKQMQPINTGKQRRFSVWFLYLFQNYLQVWKKYIKEYQNNVSPELLQTVFSPPLGFCCPPTEDKSVDASIYFGGKFKPEPHRAEMALAATRLPSGRVRSVIASTTLGLARAGSFTNS